MAEAPRRTVSVTRSLESDVSPYILSEDILEKLKLLDYENQFCHVKNFKPLTRQYFSMPQANPNEQFFYFTSLVSWLMGLNHHFFPAPMQFDDPNATAANILQELKKMGFSTDFPPAKLKQGHGEAVCAVLTHLLDFTLERMEFQFRKPIHPSEAEEDPVLDDDGDGISGAEIIDDAIAAEDDDDDTLFMDLPTVPRDKEPVQTAIVTEVDPEEWRLELERVEPQLKVVLAPDNKEWRAHVEQTRMHHQAITAVLPDTRAMLERILADVSVALEKIQSREKYINSQLEHVVEEYKVVQEKFNRTNEQYAVASETIAQLTNKLAAVTDELDSIKADMENKNSGMTDTGPIIKIKTALQKLKNENKQMEVRAAVIEHTLLQGSLRNRITAVGPAPAVNIDIEPGEYT